MACVIAADKRDNDPIVKHRRASVSNAPPKAYPVAEANTQFHSSQILNRSKCTKERKVNTLVISSARYHIALRSDRCPPTPHNLTSSVVDSFY
jgi:hypothetical protein